MREIRFRGKSRSTGEWIIGMNVFFLCNDERTEFRALITRSGSHVEHKLIEDQAGKRWEHIHDSEEVDVETIGQDTGMTDKNRSRIFEGDVVTGPDFDDEDGYAVIRWDSQTARFVIEGKSLVVDFDNYYGYDLEVIGNIFDNKELLEGD